MARTPNVIFERLERDWAKAAKKAAKKAARLEAKKKRAEKKKQEKADLEPNGDQLPGAPPSNAPGAPMRRIAATNETFAASPPQEPFGRTPKISSVVSFNDRCIK